jgi:hypothetical protein
MEELGKQFEGKLKTAIQIFKNEYPKKFLCQLIAGQIDIDRLDYLGRDSFFSGVTDGQVGVERIIKMLNVCDGNLVIEKKGIYSIEKFLIARRYMYWQVYLHKTVVSAEFLLINILNRAKELATKGTTLFSTPSLAIFLEGKIDESMFRKKVQISGLSILEHFAMLDDNDILASIKVWQNHADPVLSYLSKCLINRVLFKVQFSNKPFPQKTIEKIKSEIKKHFKVGNDEIQYFFIHQQVTNSAYNNEGENIRIISNNGKIKDFAKASDINLSALSKIVRKFFLCYPKELDFN